MRHGKPRSAPSSSVLVCNTGVDESAGGNAGGLYDVQNMRVSPSGGTLRKRSGHTGITPTLLGGYYAPKVLGGGLRSTALATDGSANIAITDAGIAYVVQDDGTVIEAGCVSECEPVGYFASCYVAKTAGQQLPSCTRTPQGFVAVALAPMVVLQSPDGAVLYREVAQDSATPCTKCSVLSIGEQVFLLVELLGVVTLRKFSDGRTNIVDTSATFTPVANSTWDCCLSETGDKILVVYQSSMTAVTLRGYNTDGSLWGTVSFTVTGAWYALSVAAFGGQVWIGCYKKDTKGLYAYIWEWDSLDVTLALTPLSPSAPSGTYSYAAGPPLFGPTRTDAWLNPTTMPALCVVSSVGVLDGSRGICAFCVDTDGSIESAGFTPNVVPVSKPDSRQRVWAIPIARKGTPDLYRMALLRYRILDNLIVSYPSVALCTEAMLWNPAAFDPELRSDSFHAVVATSDGCFVFPAVRTLSSSASNVAVEGRALMYRAVRAHSVASAHGVVVSGHPIALAKSPGSDETLGIECGWLSCPAILGCSFVPSTLGSSLLAGTYSLRTVWEHVDTQGRRHLSRPSQVETVTVPADGGAIHSFWTSASATHRARRQTRLLVYRTLGEGGVQSTQYYSSGSAVPSVATAIYCKVVDSHTDDELADEEPIYTDGSFKPNDSAPSCRYTVASETRLWCGGLLNETWLHASREFIPDEPINFVDDNAWRVVLPQRCTGLAQLDGVIVAFAESAIYLVTGAGPDDLGVGSFDAPRCYSSVVGCPEENARSIVSTPLGIIFLSCSGFQLIPRGFGAIQAIGDRVSDTLASSGAYCVAAAATETPQGTEARFLVAASAEAVTGMHQVLAYDCGSGQWYRDVLPHNAGMLGAWKDGFVHARQTLLASGVQYYYQHGAATSDVPSTQIAAKIQTAWQHPFGVGGYGRVNRLVLATEGHPVRLRATIETDHGHTQEATIDFDESRAPYNYRELALACPQLGAYRVLLEELSYTGTNSAFGAVAIMAELDDSDALRPSDAEERY